jgi:hypothetical protein
MVERYIKTAEEILRKVVASHQRDWDARLLILFLAYRASTHNTTRLSPSSLVFGRELRLPCDLLFETCPNKERPKSITLHIYWTIYTTSIIISTDT